MDKSDQNSIIIYFCLIALELKRSACGLMDKAFDF